VWATRGDARRRRGCAPQNRLAERASRRTRPPNGLDRAIEPMVVFIRPRCSAICSVTAVRRANEDQNPAHCCASICAYATSGEASQPQINLRRLARIAIFSAPNSVRFAGHSDSTAHGSRAPAFRQRRKENYAPGHRDTRDTCGFTSEPDGFPGASSRVSHFERRFTHRHPSSSAVLSKRTSSRRRPKPSEAGAGIVRTPPL